MAASTSICGESGEKALERLRKVDPPLYLSPSPELSVDTRAAARYLFSSLFPYCPKPPIDALLADEGFDAEQIWSQIDLLSRPILSFLRREVKRLEREPPAVPAPEALPVNESEVITGGEDEEEEDIEEGDGEDGEEVNDEEMEDEEGEADEDEGGEGGERMNGVEDRFLKIKELEEYLEDDEAREYGLQRKGGRAIGKEEDNSDEVDDEDDDNDEGNPGFEDLDGDGDDDAENARYEDFFERTKETGGKKNRNVQGKTGPALFKNESSGDEEKDNEGTLSTHEKKLFKLRAKIEEMEKANLEPKMWTMQGEVTAAKRPKNSALEVDLDFEHNARPPPVITEEVTASIEDLIKKRIVEGHFDDVQRTPDLPSKAPKEFKELDETKSKKGLAEIYEEEYAQRTGLVPAPLSSSDEQKKEATLLFKRLCLKLDALAHFHFAPKPVIEEMSIQANVPALAMEEIAPLAVSYASMLAPEEIFQGKGDIKEESELTQAERKRRRASKKRKFKADNEKREAKKARRNVGLTHANGKEDL